MKSSSEDSEITEDKTLLHTQSSVTSSRQDTPATLVIWLPKSRRGEQYVLENSLTIGRSKNCAISVSDSSMSKRHATISVTSDRIALVDHNSTNNTYLDREKVPPETPVLLEHNCSIKMGNTIFMFYKKGSVEAGTMPLVFKQAYLDPLTEILNKRALLERGPELLDKAKKNGLPFCLAMFDIDHFKRVNDEHPEGHFAGDYVLKEVAQLVQNSIIRVDDFFARFGGEEFVFTLYGAQLKKGAEICERLRKRIEQHSFEYSNIKIPITVSIGLTEFLATQDNFDSLLKRADKGLYKAKNSGRNKVVVE